MECTSNHKLVADSNIAISTVLKVGQDLTNTRPAVDVGEYITCTV